MNKLFLYFFPCLENFTFKDSKVDKIILCSLSQTQYSSSAEALGASRAHNYSCVPLSVDYSSFMLLNHLAVIRSQMQEVLIY